MYLRFFSLPWPNHITAATPWPTLAASVNFPPAAATLTEAQQLGTYLILEGESPQAEALGFHATARTITVQSITDLRNPKLPIVWQHSSQIPVFHPPAKAGD